MHRMQHDSVQLACLSWVTVELRKLADDQNEASSRSLLARDWWKGGRSLMLWIGTTCSLAISRLG